jgi:hypothetical protein
VVRYQIRRRMLFRERSWGGIKAEEGGIKGFLLLRMRVIGGPAEIMAGTGSWTISLWW